MVGALAAAAGGQARILAGFERGRERTDAEQQDQQDGKRAPHLELIVHQSADLRNEGANRYLAVGYHRFIKKSTQRQRECRCLK